MRVAMIVMVGRGRGAPAHSGFTLLELSIVILLLGVLATAALPSFVTAYSQFKLEAAADAVATALVYAQNVAIQRQHTVEVTFDANNEEFELADVNDGVLLLNPLTRKDYMVEFGATPMLAGVDIASAAFGDQSKVSFDYLGRLSSPGSVMLQYSEGTLWVTVSGVVGRIRVTSTPE